MSILIKGALLRGEITDILIEGKYIREVGPSLAVTADSCLDGTGKAVIPGFVNTHTHAAMTLFRGFADDMPLMPWLEEKIWPNEAKLTSEDVYWGSRLACLEMIKTGTTTFLDMYHKHQSTALAVEEIGLRATLCAVAFDHFQPEKAEKAKAYIRKSFDDSMGYSKRIRYALGPHAIYTVSGELLQWLDEFANENQLPLHLHLSETATEVENSIRQFGLSPVRYLYKLGILSPRLILAHAIWLDSDEIRMLADHEVKVVHNPLSNMKLASGMEFKYNEMRDAGVVVGLGTDGCASSNNLDMVEAMKFASLLGKSWRKDPEAMPAGEMVRMATANGAQILGLNAGEIKPGTLADLSLINLKSPAFTPNFNLESNLVYAANGSCIDTVICDGKILMQDARVAGEEEILEKAAAVAYDLMKR